MAAHLAATEKDISRLLHLRTEAPLFIHELHPIETLGHVFENDSDEGHNYKLNIIT